MPRPGLRSPSLSIFFPSPVSCLLCTFSLSTHRSLKPESNLESKAISHALCCVFLLTLPHLIRSLLSSQILHGWEGPPWLDTPGCIDRLLLSCPVWASRAAALIHASPPLAGLPLVSPGPQHVFPPLPRCFPLLASQRDSSLL